MLTSISVIVALTLEDEGGAFLRNVENQEPATYRN
jgi:hypothetical protein